MYKGHGSIVISRIIKANLNGKLISKAVEYSNFLYTISAALSASIRKGILKSFLSVNGVFTNIKNPRSKYPQKGSLSYLKTLVKRSATLGANSTIVCGITIGEYAFIGAGAVIVKDVPPFALVIGNPGKVVGFVDKKGNRVE